MRNILVVGASGGIGKELSVLLADDGQRVYGTYNRSAPNLTKDNLSWHPLHVLESEPDLEFLPEKLDGLVYCPGSINLLPFGRIKAHDFVSDYELQVVGAIKVLQRALPQLKASGAASVVLFSTVAVQTGFNFHSMVGASKGAIEGLTRSLAAEFAPSIRVNAIAPSITDTPLAEKLLNTDEKRMANAQRHPLRKIGTPGDIASMAEFLLSPKSSWITGQIMKVDGGVSAVKL